MKKVILFASSALLITSIIFSCSKGGDKLFSFSGKNINLFTIEQDKELGLSMNEQIQANPAEFPVLDKKKFPEAYHHIERIRDSILNSDLITYKNDFPWEVYIIANDSVLNAFAVPGGYMYFYTGLIRFLSAEDEFAGVMAHEMAHVDRRHSTQMLTKQYGLSFLLDVLLGVKGSNEYIKIASGLATGLAGLSFSRENEYEADEMAVKYMYTTAYDARGVKKFFEKLEGSGATPEFLSTHPSPPNRIKNIENVWNNLNQKSGTVKEGNTFSREYTQFKNSLPPAIL